MANLNLTSVWTSNVTSIAATDPVQGAAGGDPNQGVNNTPHVELGKRTEWLRAQVITNQNSINANIAQITQNLNDIADLDSTKYEKTGGEITGNTLWNNRVVEFKGTTAVQHDGAGAILHVGTGTILHAGAGNIEHSAAGNIKHSGSGHIEHSGSGKIVHSNAGDIQTVGGRLYASGNAGKVQVSDTLIDYGYGIRSDDTYMAGMQYTKTAKLAITDPNPRSAGYEYFITKVDNTANYLGAADGDFDIANVYAGATDPRAWYFKIWGKASIDGSPEFFYGEGVIVVDGSMPAYSGWTLVHEDPGVTTTPARYKASIYGASVTTGDTEVGALVIKNKTDLIFVANTATLGWNDLRLTVTWEAQNTSI